MCLYPDFANDPQVHALSNVLQANNACVQAELASEAQ